MWIEYIISYEFQYWTNVNACLHAPAALHVEEIPPKPIG
jgi:hypothetical protein